MAERFLFTENHYRIEGFYPPDPKESHMSSWGFNIVLSKEFALLAKNKEMDKSTEQKFIEQGNIIVERCIPNMSLYYYGSMMFHDGCLLHSACVPGDRTGLDLEHNAYSALENNYCDEIKYLPHNVDNRDQAACSLAVWLRWWELAAVYIMG